MTNEQKLKNLNTKDLANFLLSNDDCTMCARRYKQDCLIYKEDTYWQCREGIADWLKEEADV